MSKHLRIGTRSSRLAIWQAELAGSLLKEAGYETKLVFIKSEGDVDTTTPLTDMGGKGVFTKAIDEALLNNQIDIAVHSFKDLPTENPLPLRVAAVLERGDPRDVLVCANKPAFLEDASKKAVIATGSNRRKSQWLHRYPTHELIPFRGNVQTRIQKVLQGNIDGAIFAAAGLQRLGMDHQITEYLDWMVPAPAQGAVALMIRDDETREITQSVESLNHNQTALCTSIERQLLNRMEAGCSAPVGAFAWTEENTVSLVAAALATDGSVQYDVELTASLEECRDLGTQAADMLLAKGADKLMALYGSKN